MATLTSIQLAITPGQSQHITSIFWGGQHVGLKWKSWKRTQRSSERPILHWWWNPGRGSLSTDTKPVISQLSAEKSTLRFASSQFNVLSNKSCCPGTWRRNPVTELQMKGGWPQLGNKLDPSEQHLPIREHQPSANIITVISKLPPAPRALGENLWLPGLRRLLTTARLASVFGIKWGFSWQRLQTAVPKGTGVRI